LRERLGEQNVRVVIRAAESADITSKGRVLFGEAHFGALSADEAQRQGTVEETVRRNLQNVPNTFVTAIDAVRRESGWAVRAEVAGPRILTPNEVRGVQERTAKAIGQPVDLSVRPRTDLLVTGTQYQALGDVRLEEGEASPTPEARAP